jgi:hypothetical protein
MKERHTGLDLAGIFIIILIALQPSCHKEGSNANILAGNPHRVVTISSSSTGVSNPCEVDFPVTLLRISKQHTIAWAAEDHDFWIAFDPSKRTPIGTNNIKVASGTQTSAFPITSSSAGYFMYAVYDSDPSSNPSAKPCKVATDERDTGLNVKP